MSFTMNKNDRFKLWEAKKNKKMKWKKKKVILKMSIKISDKHKNEMRNDNNFCFDEYDEIWWISRLVMLDMKSVCAHKRKQQQRARIPNIHLTSEGSDNFMNIYRNSKIGRYTTSFILFFLFCGSCVFI